MESGGIRMTLRHDRCPGLSSAAEAYAFVPRGLLLFTVVVAVGLGNGYK
jgi:hypothetical protein